MRSTSRFLSLISRGARDWPRGHGSRARSARVAGSGSACHGETISFWSRLDQKVCGYLFSCQATVYKSRIRAVKVHLRMRKQRTPEENRERLLRTVNRQGSPGARVVRFTFWLFVLVLVLTFLTVAVARLHGGQGNPGAHRTPNSRQVRKITG
jgi:hypothetical protein